MKTHIEPRDRGLVVVLCVTIFLLGLEIGSYLDPVSRRQAAGLFLSACALFAILRILWNRAEDPGQLTPGTRERLRFPREGDR